MHTFSYCETCVFFGCKVMCILYLSFCEELQVQNAHYFAAKENSFDSKRILYPFKTITSVTPNKTSYHRLHSYFKSYKLNSNSVLIVQHCGHLLHNHHHQLQQHQQESTHISKLLLSKLSSVTVTRGKISCNRNIDSVFLRFFFFLNGDGQNHN